MRKDGLSYRQRERQREKQTSLTNLIVAFRSFANSSIKLVLITSVVFGDRYLP